MQPLVEKTTFDNLKIVAFLHINQSTEQKAKFKSTKNETKH